MGDFFSTDTIVLLYFLFGFMYLSLFLGPAVLLDKALQRILSETPGVFFIVFMLFVLAWPLVWLIDIGISISRKIKGED